MSAVRLLVWLAVLFGSCLLPVLPQSVPACEQFTLVPLVGPGMPLTIVEGRDQELTCSHYFVGAHATTWYREASAIRTNMPEGPEGCSCESTTSSSSVTLTFTNFAAASAGEYSCRIPDPFNDPAQNVCRFDVRVAEAPNIQEPVVERYEKSVGNNLFIRINATGVPPPSITWRNGSSGELLTNDNQRTTISSTGSLTLNDLMPSDRGNYTLMLSNLAGTRTMNFSVFVHFVEYVEISSPELVNGQIRVTCEAIGYPTVVVEWQDSTGQMLALDTSEMQDPFDRRFTGTLSVDQGACRDPYTCIVRNMGATVRMTRPVHICSRADPPPRPVNVTVTQNGQNSVQVSWKVETDSAGSFQVCYRAIAPTMTDKMCGSVIESEDRSVTVAGLTVGVQYSFKVISSRNDMSNESVEVNHLQVDCSQEIRKKVIGVSVGTTVNQGERTFNISWAQPSEDSVHGYTVSSGRGWTMVVRQKIITSIVTPGNFCNGQEHTFIVMAMNSCGDIGPASAGVIGKCETLGRIRITSVTSYSTAIAVQWTLKSPDYSVQSPLSITVREMQLSSDGRQLQRNYSIGDVLDKAECLGELKASTFYKVCLHAVYTDGVMESEPVCADVETRANVDPDNIDDFCSKPESTHFIGAPVTQINLPDYAIALIVVGLLIILALIFCLGGICLACSNTKGKNIEDIGSEYSSSIAPAMQGRMSNNHSRNMSPSRSCLSYHSKGHSTNWNDHMGTLREMETEVGTNV